MTSNFSFSCFQTFVGIRFKAEPDAIVWSRLLGIAYPPFYVVKGQKPALFWLGPLFKKNNENYWVNGKIREHSEFIFRGIMWWSRSKNCPLYVWLGTLFKKNDLNSWIFGIHFSWKYVVKPLAWYCPPTTYSTSSKAKKLHLSGLGPNLRKII